MQNQPSLINLRHLEIEDNPHLTYMPRGLRELMKLQTLSIYMVGKGSGEKSKTKMGRLSELKSLNNLRGQLWIAWFSYRIRGVETAHEEAILEGKEQLDSLGLIWMEKEEGSEEIVSIMGNLKPH